VDFITTRNALTEDVISKSAGHATVFRVGEEKNLAARLKDLAGRHFGYTASQIRRAAFPFANNRSISHLWDKQNMMQPNGNIALRKPEGKKGMNEKTVEDHFQYG
jgi:hypothetical protein